MKTILLGQDEQRYSGYTHRFTVDYTDLSAAATTKTLSLISGLALGSIVKEAAYYLETSFDGGATSALTLKVGYNLAAGTDDDDSFVAGNSIHADSSPVLAGDGNGAAFATLRTGYAFQESAAIEALFTATGANLNTLTQGKVHIFLAVVDMKKLV